MSCGDAISIINDKGQFNEGYTHFCQSKSNLSETLANNDAFVCISVFGPQSSGKSTLLNDLFATNFKTMESAAGRNQTTKGIVANSVPFQAPTSSSLLILDCEGSDSRERNQQDFHNIERHIGCFAAAVSDLFVINVWNHDIGRHSAANYNVLSTIFDIYFKSLLPARQSAGNTRQLMILVAVRDAEEDGMELTKEIFSSDVHRIFEQSIPKQYHDSFAKYFDLRFWFIPHRKYLRSAYDKMIEQIRADIRSICATLFGGNSATGLMSLMDSATYYASIWKTVRSDKDLNIPSQRELLSNVRCEDFYREAETYFRSKVKDIASSVSTAVESSLQKDVLATQVTGTNFTNSTVSVKDYSIVTLHNSCNSLKLTNALLKLAQDTVFMYQKKTRHYIPKIVNQWESRLTNEIVAEVRFIVGTFIKGVREATCQALQALTVPFCTEIKRWLDQCDFDDHHTTGSNEVDVLIPELITDTTLSVKKLGDLISLLGLATKIFDTCIANDWCNTYEALVGTGIFVNLPSPITITDETTPLPSILVPKDPTKERMVVTTMDGEDVIDRIKSREVYSPILCALLKNLHACTYGRDLMRYLAEKEKGEMPRVTNAYDAVCLLHTTVLLWYCETILPLSILYNVESELNHIVPESNLFFCDAMSTIQQTVSDAISTQTRTLVASAAHATARALGSNLYSELGSLRGVVYGSSKKSLERSLFSLLSSNYVDPDHQALLKLQSYLSGTLHFTSDRLEPMLDISSSAFADESSFAFAQYMNMCTVTHISVLSPNSRASSFKGVRTHHRSTNLSVPKYVMMPIVAALDVNSFYLPQATLMRFMDKIDMDIINALTKAINDFFVNTAASVLRSRMRMQLICDDHGAQQKYVSTVAIDAEFERIRNRLVSTVEAFEKGVLITEDLREVTIKPVPKEKILSTLQHMESEWEDVHQEALDIYRAKRYRDHGKWVWLALFAIALFFRQFLYRIITNRYVLTILMIMGSMVAFIHFRVSPSDRDAALVLLADNIRKRDVNGALNSIVSFVHKAF